MFSAAKLFNAKFFKELTLKVYLLVNAFCWLGVKSKRDIGLKIIVKAYMLCWKDLVVTSSCSEFTEFRL